MQTKTAIDPMKCIYCGSIRTVILHGMVRCMQCGKNETPD